MYVVGTLSTCTHVSGAMAEGYSCKKAKLCCSASNTPSISQFFKAKASCSIPTLPLSSSDSESNQQSNGEAAAAKQPKLTAVSSSRVSNYAQLTSCSSTDTVVAVHLEPYQPRKRFPKITDGEQSRSFQYDWFGKWPWLEWDDNRECAFCHPCRMAEKLHFVSFSKKAEGAFSSDGFRSWKVATGSFRKHESSHSHKEAVLKWVHYTKSQPVTAQLSKQVLNDQSQARNCLFKIVSTLRFLAHQGLAARGHEEVEGNFLQLLLLRSEDCSDLCGWLQKQGTTQRMIFKTKYLK